MSDHTPTAPVTQTKEIPLTQGQVAIVDAADYEWLSQWKWYADKHGDIFYPSRKAPGPNGKPTRIRMHQVILGKGADHIDGDGLNNTRLNLRLATNQQNQCNVGPRTDNTSGFKGVSWYKANKKWRAKIRVNGKRIHLGYFDDAIEAAKAYDQAAREYHGEFARLNFGGDHA